MTAINRNSVIGGSTTFIRDLLAGKITDPLTGRSGDSKFVITSYPDRSVQYPVITVQQQNLSNEPAGVGTTETHIKLGMEINVWTKNVEQRDQLAGSVLAVIEQNRLGVIAASGLFSNRINNITQLDEEGKAGVHRAVIETSFLYPSQ